MRALSIRQPYAELILRGSKRIEFRSMTARNLIGQRFYIYAAKGPATKRRSDVATEGRRIWSDNLAIPGTVTGGAPVPQWMLELAEELILGKLPTGVIVGTAVIEDVTRGEHFYEWHLADVQRAKKLRKVTGHPQPVWFRPF